MLIHFVALLVLATAARPGNPLPSEVVSHNDSFELRARAEDGPRGPRIHFTLRYLASSPLSLYPFELPWGNPNSTEVWARTTAGRSLRVVYPIADPAPEAPFVLHTGDIRQGDFALADRVIGLSEALEKSDVIITWQYPLHPKGQPITGRIRFHKRRPPRKGPGAA